MCYSDHLETYTKTKKWLKIFVRPLNSLCWERLFLFTRLNEIGLIWLYSRTQEGLCILKLYQIQSDSSVEQCNLSISFHLLNDIILLLVWVCTNMLNDCWVKSLISKRGNGVNSPVSNSFKRKVNILQNKEHIKLTKHWRLMIEGQSLSRC